LTASVGPGYPGCEYQIREALADVLGEDKSNFFFDKASGISRSPGFMATILSSVPGIFFRRSGRQILQVTRIELHSNRSQLSSF
jgi:hypothetical protein